MGIVYAFSTPTAREENSNNLKQSTTQRLSNKRMIIAFVKERFHNAVEIDILGIFGRVFIVTNLASPKNSSGANSSGANDVIAIDHVLCLSHVFPHVSACLFVESDLLRSSNYSSSGENQPIDENKNESPKADSLRRKKWPTWLIACSFV